MANFVSPFENGVAEGVASDTHDTTFEVFPSYCMICDERDSIIGMNILLNVMTPDTNCFMMQ